MPVHLSKWPGLTPGSKVLIRFGGLLVVLLFFPAACRFQEADQGTPRDILPTIAVEPPKTEPLPQKKSNPVEEKAPPATATMQPAPSPTLPPAAAAAEPTPITLDEEEVSQRLTIIAAKETAVAEPLIDCANRMPGSDLHALVTLDYGLNRDFAPDDLVALAGEVPYHVTLGYPTEVRGVVLKPLVRMINDMLDAGLQPQILSGYRSYAAQVIARDKWNTLYPDRASIISAPPGHSEHQLGTVIDFGSPELPGLVGQPGIQFHTYFYKTSEGQWLAENAHKYGFTLSYPLEAFEITGFYYEPWHYRYVGEKMAQQLHEQETTLTEFQLANHPPPCLP